MLTADISPSVASGAPSKRLKTALSCFYKRIASQVHRLLQTQPSSFMLN